MAKFYVKPRIFRDRVLPCLVAGTVAATTFFGVNYAVSSLVSYLKGDGKEGSSTVSGVSGDVYVCAGCGKEYINHFPYTSPWAEYPTELPVHEIVDIRETSNNGSIGGATPVSMFQRVTGNLSSRDDQDIYCFTTDATGIVNFSFSFDGSNRGYAYLWDGTIYGSDGETVLNAGSIPSNEGESTIFDTGESDLRPGTYYLKISAASGGNPFLNGYSDTDYHITFRPECKEHTSVTQVLTETPTCSRAGELVRICDRCDAQISTEPIEPSGHLWSTWKVVEENFFSSVCGEYRRVCALCGEEETNTLLFHFLEGAPKTDAHAVTVTETWTASGSAPCASGGFVQTVCSVCGNVEVERMENTEHSYGEWTTVRAATCSAEGLKSRTCAACGRVEAETLDCIPHAYGKAVRVSGSILNAPIVSQKTCAECGYVSTAESGWSRWILPALIVLGIAAAVPAVVLAQRMMRASRKKRARKRLEKTFLCPYCFETALIRKMEFRCPDQHCPARRPAFGDKCIQWDAKGLPHAVKCSCGKFYEAFCPNCHKLLPESTLTGDDMIISVVGSRDTGKTHFISVIINELIGRIIPAFGGSFEGFADTSELYTRVYKRQLYEGLRRLEGTGTFQQNMKDEDKPLIYTLKLQEKGLLGRGENVRLFTLVFFDSAGEDLQKPVETMRRINRYICKSKGIIFLLDPLKIPAVRAQLDAHEVDRASSGAWYQPDDILVRISNLIRKDGDQGLRDSDKIDIPVSVVFSKFDVIEPIIPRGCTILEPSPHCEEGMFDLSDGQNVHAEVQGLLQSWGAESFLRQLEMNYKNYSCFAVSALGMHNNPDSDGKISRPRPHRIEDPLLWLLMKQGVIRANKNRRKP